MYEGSKQIINAMNFNHFKTNVILSGVVEHHSRLKQPTNVR